MPGVHELGERLVGGQRVGEIPGNEPPRIGGVEISIMEETQSRWLAFQRGDTDIEYQLAEVAPKVKALFEQYDLILDGTDTFETRYILNDAAVAAGIPVVSYNADGAKDDPGTNRLAYIGQGLYDSGFQLGQRAIASGLESGEAVGFIATSLLVSRLLTGPIDRWSSPSSW
jgi:hypothetical protein